MNARFTLLSASVFSRNRACVSLHSRPRPRRTIWIKCPHWSIFEFLVRDFPQTSYTEHIARWTLFIIYSCLETFMSSRGNCFCACYSQAITRSASCKRGTSWSPWFKCHSRAPVLLCNMRLERKFSIERFPSCMLSKTVIFYSTNIEWLCTMYKPMITQHYLSATKISSYQRPSWRIAVGRRSFNYSPMPSGIMIAMVDRESAQAAAETVWVRTSVNGVGSQHLRS